ncbi:putative ATP-binding protein BAB2_1147 [[Clostridium] ultunense Esp]|uniref:ABC transporter ATP-binding protein n=1 Tax=Thermicanus aegyptius TaxID=94009 RepID=UPI0002B6F190|nr:ABC transporter ATP-binding protein [Thermicanus aegyptius]CCQ97807.1 putative ATP-binding protein BAB2_1147 [[Clostridium] ultunense Esp]
MKTELEFQGVYKSFSDLQVLENVSFSVGKGEFVVIVGPSGCGKSTLLRMVAGLERPSRGEVLSRGEPIKSPSPERMMIFQEPALFPWLTVERNVAFGLELAGVSKEERQEKVNQMLERVGLGDFRHFYPSQLSGGMKQRASIARAFVMDPEILLMDEPYGALDALTRMAMQNELLSLWEGSGKTVLFITHDVDEAIALGDRVLVMRARPGKVIEELVIDLPRPRNRSGEGFSTLRQEILELLGVHPKG